MEETTLDVRVRRVGGDWRGRRFVVRVMFALLICVLELEDEKEYQIWRVLIAFGMEFFCSEGT